MTGCGVATFDEDLFQRVEGDAVIVVFGTGVGHTIASALACQRSTGGVEGVLVCVRGS